MISATEEYAFDNAKTGGRSTTFVGHNFYIGILYCKFFVGSSAYFTEKLKQDTEYHRRFHGRRRHLGCGANTAKFTVLNFPGTFEEAPPPASLC